MAAGPNYGSINTKSNNYFSSCIRTKWKLYQGVGGSCAKCDEVENRTAMLILSIPHVKRIADLATWKSLQKYFSLILQTRKLHKYSGSPSLSRMSNKRSHCGACNRRQNVSHSFVAVNNRTCTLGCIQKFFFHRPWP